MIRAISNSVPLNAIKMCRKYNMTKPMRMAASYVNAIKETQ
jgi:hypothetical protein